MDAKQKAALNEDRQNTVLMELKRQKTHKDGAKVLMATMRRKRGTVLEGPSIVLR